MSILQTKAGGNDTLVTGTLEPSPLRPFDIRVAVKATGLNPVDAKARTTSMGWNFAATGHRALGFDGAGVVTEVGSAVTTFKEGDQVYFAGDLSRHGTFGATTAVDSRIVAKMPSSMSFVEAAGIPLVALTAWEAMVEGMHIDPRDKDGANKDVTLLVVAGAGGVGSIAIQIAKQLLGVGTVVATASRDETIAFCLKNGADHVINHHKSLKEEFARICVAGADFVLDGVDVDTNFDQLLTVLNVGGKINALTVGDASKIDVSKMFVPLRASLGFTLMFSRALTGFKIELQSKILKTIQEAIDGGKLKSVVTWTKEWSLDNVKEGLDLLESGKAMGKLVLERK